MGDAASMICPRFIARSRLAILLLSPALLSSLAWSKKKVHPHKDKSEIVAAAQERAIYFRPGDVRLITGYYTPRRLPPGLQKKLYRTGHLPPGWEKRYEPLPVVLERQLPAICAGCGRGLIDNHVVVYDKKTRIILDVVALVAASR